ncbi:MAG: monooxygenase, partial [Gaiellaceae bacterium]
LESAPTARTRALAIAAQVESRRMPPWLPGPASPAYVGESERTLSESEIGTIVAWARSGAPIDGPALAAPDEDAMRVADGERAVELELPQAYTPAGETDDYRCFLLDPQLEDDAFVTSALIRPGAPSVVHHVILFRAAPDQVAEAERLDAAESGQGWTCFGGTGLSVGVDSLADAGWIAAWAPGSDAVRYPAGTGSKLAAGSRIVMQVHYNLQHGRDPDRTAAVLTLAPGTAALEPAATMLLPAPIELPCTQGERGPLCDRDAAVADLARKRGASAALLPAGLLLLCGRNPFSPDAGPESSCDQPFREPTTIHGVAGHMHLLGRSIRIELLRSDGGTRVLLDIPRWDFHWQSAYMLEEAVVAEPGDRVRVTCRHDVALRETEPRYIVWGEGTTDEMCLGVLQVTRGS